MFCFYPDDGSIAFFRGIGNNVEDPAM